MNKKKHPKWMQIIEVILFFSWFIGSMFAMFYFFPKSVPVGMMFVGQYFTVFGYFISTSKQEDDSYPKEINNFESEIKYVNKTLGIIIMLLGSVIFAFFFILECGNENIVKTLNKNENKLLLVFFIVFYVTFIVYFIWEKRMLSKKYSEEVVATVVDLILFDKLYQPIISYEFGGKVYTVPTRSANAFRQPQIGDVINILVNPNNPEEYITSSQKN